MNQTEAQSHLSLRRQSPAYDGVPHNVYVLCRDGKSIISADPRDFDILTFTDAYDEAVAKLSGASNPKTYEIEAGKHFHFIEAPFNFNELDVIDF